MKGNGLGHEGNFSQSFFCSQTDSNKMALRKASTVMRNSAESSMVAVKVKER
jgi:hypothetical protein